ncbi:MAG: hydrogenase maturation nickel metallochaperone HypA [Candidatus Aminicenantes bacterium]|nr:hydrogenase maturation nickel metallochaperone HypA [Candidatus Aminicenantes bacterium]
MHELSLIANLFEIMEQKAKQKKAKKITYVKLKVGVLSGAVPELLETAFDIYKKDTIADQAKLEIEKVPLKIRCKECGTETIKSDLVLNCGKCRSTDLENLEGTELYLEKMELEIE